VRYGKAMTQRVASVAGLAPGGPGGPGYAGGPDYARSPIERQSQANPVGPIGPAEPGQRTLLALGAHYDDCVFGIPGILVKAARRGWRVVIVALIGDYANFAPVAAAAAGKAGGSARKPSAVLREGCVAICRHYGAEMRFLDLKGHHLEATPAAMQAVAQVVAEVRPALGFNLWPDDRHGDHGPASRIGESALRHAGPLLDDLSIVAPRRLYAYDNGPRHTIGFTPDTYVDISEEWPAAREWLARFMALAYGAASGTPAGTQDGAPAQTHHAVLAKEALALYRGEACGVPYAEALTALNAYPQEVL
jgi:LmbE family N-acetylglucosaminyl deacetylase